MLGTVQVNDVPDAGTVTVTGYLDQTGLVNPAPPISTRRVQYDVLNQAGNGIIFDFRVDYAPGTTVIGADVADGYYDSAGTRFTFWSGSGFMTLFDVGFGTYTYDVDGFGSEWQIDYASDHVSWHQIQNGFAPDTATGETNFGFNPTFALEFKPGTPLGLEPASVSGLTLTGGAVSATGQVLSAVVPEPGTFALVLLGLGAAGLAGRSQRSRVPTT